MKHLTSIKAVTKPDAGYWMNPAYRIPLGRFPLVSAIYLPGNGDQHAPHRDRGELVDHHSHRRRKCEDGDRLPSAASPGTAVTGISTVEVSSDRGRNVGRRESRRGSRPLRVPHLQLHALAQSTRQANGDGACHQQDRQTQTSELIHNPSGYNHNVVHSVTFNLA